MNKRKVKAVANIRKPKPPTGAGELLSADTIMRVERRYSIMSLRRDGYTVQEIASALGVSPTTVRADLVFTLNEIIKETAETTEEARQLELERIDGLLREYYPRSMTRTVLVDDKDRPGQKKEVVVGGDLSAGHFVIALSKRRSELLALDKAAQKGGEESGIRVYVGVDVDLV